MVSDCCQNTSEQQLWQQLQVLHALKSNRCPHAIPAPVAACKRHPSAMSVPDNGAQMGSILHTQFKVPLGTSQAANRRTGPALACQASKLSDLPASSTVSSCSEPAAKASTSGTAQLPMDWSLKTLVRFSAASEITCCTAALAASGALGAALSKCCQGWLATCTSSSKCRQPWGFLQCWSCDRSGLVLLHLAEIERGQGVPRQAGAQGTAMVWGRPIP